MNLEWGKWQVRMWSMTHKAELIGQVDSLLGPVEGY